MIQVQESVFGEAQDKGLKPGAIGLLSSVVIGVASTAPAYSLAATLGFIVAIVGLQTPVIVLLAFVPIFLISIGYQQLNKADPDCGTTFTWAARAFGPRTGWMGGWGIIAADVLVMASLAQVAGQYVFGLFGAHGIEHDATSPWVLTVGLLWMVLMTYICYRGIEVSAAIQRILLSIEIVMLTVMSVVALIKVYSGNGVKGISIHPAWAWFNPFHLGSFSTFSQGILLMLFIYWGWDSTVSVNEETEDPGKTPGRAAIISTLILLGIYAVVSVAVQAFAGVAACPGATAANPGTCISLGNPSNQNDVLSTLGSAIFGAHGFGLVLSKLLVLMVLTSAAASTQTTILPTARTTLSMAAFKSVPVRLGKIHPKYFSPTGSTIWMGIISAIFYVAMNFFAGGNVIGDAVTACGIMIAFYYGLTGFACVWYFRRDLGNNAREFIIKGLAPLLGGIIMWVGMVLTTIQDWKPVNSFVTWNMHFAPHWKIGFSFLLGAGSMAIGLVVMSIAALFYKPYFHGETLPKGTLPTEAEINH